MIFLFFGTSVALLEAELAPFEDWEEIGDIGFRRVFGKKKTTQGHKEYFVVSPATLSRSISIACILWHGYVDL